jgi:ATP-dependent DNA ligase
VIVVADDDGSVDFSALQTRLSSARHHASRIALERPAVLVTFDVLEIAGSKLVAEPLSARRVQLERLLAARHPCLQLVEQTADAKPGLG